MTLVCSYSSGLSSLARGRAAIGSKLHHSSHSHVATQCHVARLSITASSSASSAATVSTSATSAAPVALDPSYGSKEVIKVDKRVYQYILEHTREPEILAELRRETATMIGKEMQVSPEQGAFLAMLVRLMGARRCIELGVYTGYSSLSVALALPSDGLLVACERVPHTFAVAQRFYEKGGVKHKVDPRLGLAQDTLQQLLEEGQAGSFDFAFLDADKRMYREYYELLLTLLRPGGLLVVDNVLWHGQLADPQAEVRAEAVTCGEKEGATAGGADGEDGSFAARRERSEKEEIEERGSVEGTVTMAAYDGREGGEVREDAEGTDGVGEAEDGDLRARRRSRRAERKARKAQSTESTGSTPRGMSEWRTRPLVPHGASQWPQIQSLAATSAGASLSIDAIFAALGLPPLADGHPQLPVRVRQHVNPLKTSLMAPPPPVDWVAVYEDPSLPLVVDIGSASGRLVLALAVRDWRWRAQQQGNEGEQGEEGQEKEEREEGDGSDAKAASPPSSPVLSSSPATLPLASATSFLPAPPLNFLGFEIRDKLVQRADTWRRQLALRNAHFVVANATSALESVLATYPGPLVSVSILCPDPHFKNKHRKRRVVPGGHVFVESDVEEVAADMYRQFAGYGRGGGEGDAGDERGRGKSEGEGGESESEGEERENEGEESSTYIKGVATVRFVPSDLVAAGGTGVGAEGEESVWQERAGGGSAGEGSAGEGSAGEGSAGEAIRWLDHNPLGMPSEREVVVLLQGSPMYRALFVKQ
ncbi:unnamed protein product [Closterium sp. Naga37s-1]|nr:unnamed protein product [Closterium sp. Naga37s-1]